MPMSSVLYFALRFGFRLVQFTQFDFPNMRNEMNCAVMTTAIFSSHCGVRVMCITQQVHHTVGATFAAVYAFADSLVLFFLCCCCLVHFVQLASSCCFVLFFFLCVLSADSARALLLAQWFRVLLLRRLRLPLPPTSRLCRCGRLLDSFGHHRALGSSGGYGKTGIRCGECCDAHMSRGRESRHKRVCARPRPPSSVNDGRRLEVVVDGLPVFGGAQLAVDTTVVSLLHCDGSPHRGAADVDGAVLAAARRRKERTCPELVRPGRRARLVVLAGDVAGRWSEETVSFIRCQGPGSRRTDHPEEEGRASLANEMVLSSVHHVVNDWRFASLDLAA